MASKPKPRSAILIAADKMVETIKAPVADFSGVETKAVDALAIFENITDLVNGVRRANVLVAERTRALEEAVADLNKLVLFDIPDAMELAGLTELKLKDGALLKVGDDLKVNISKANESDAFTWIRKEGHGMSIKESLVVDLRALEMDDRKKIVMAVNKLGVTPELEASIHHSTLKALVKEMLEAGKQVTTAISVHQFKKATVKEPKERT